MVRETIKKTYAYLASTELAVGLFIVICVIAVPGTFLEKKDLYKHPLFLFFLVLLAVNLVLCTVRRYKSLSNAVILLHCGVLVTLAGCVATSFGYVATVNVYEGTKTDTVYRWDMQQDHPLGFDLTVRKINREYYPVPVKVGVLRGEEKVSLHILRTGETFVLDGYTVKADELELPGENLRLSVAKDGRVIGSCDTVGRSSLPPGFPYQFKLVAFQNPVLKRMWVDLTLGREGNPSVDGSAEVNHPLQWDGLYFYNTQVARDDAGTSYAGIQIVNDPGRPLVFTGMAITSLGVVLLYARKRMWR